MSDSNSTSTPISGSVPNADLRCSFCDKHHTEVQKLIAGPKVYICDDCVVLCVEILGEHSAAPPPKKPVFNVQLADWSLRQAEPSLLSARRLRSLDDFSGTGELLREAGHKLLLALNALVADSKASMGDEYGACIQNAILREPEVLRTLQRTDERHVLLRFTLDGADLDAAAIVAAERAVEELLELVRARRAVLGEA